MVFVLYILSVLRELVGYFVECPTVWAFLTFHPNQVKLRSWHFGPSSPEVMIFFPVHCISRHLMLTSLVLKDTVFTFVINVLWGDVLRPYS